MNAQILSLIQVILSIILCTLILLQGRAGGLGAAFGGFSGLYRSKRGVEKLIYFGTIIIASLFFGTVILNFLLLA